MWNVGILVLRCALVTPVTRTLRQDDLEAKPSYIVRRWLNKSGMCLSVIFTEKKIIV